MSGTPFIDIVIPLYNEEDIIADSVSKLIGFLHTSDFPYKYKVTLVNNASTDNSREIIEGLSRQFQQVSVMNLDKKGKGLAVRTAWAASKGDIRVFMDADLASDLQFLYPLVESVISGKCDLAIGNRLGEKSHVFSRKVIRKIASRVYNFAARLLLGTNIADHQCGFKAIGGSSFDRIAPALCEDGWLIDTELIAVCCRKGLKVIPIDIIWRDTKVTKVSLVSDSIRMFGDLVRLRKRLNNMA